MMDIKKVRPLLCAALLSIVLLGGCRSDVKETPLPTEPDTPATATVAATATTIPTSTPPGATPTLRPLTTSGETTDPSAAMGDYMAEGLFISHFDSDDIATWQGYSQDTEIAVAQGKEPPEGYLNVAGWHAKQTEKWVQPTAGFQLESEEIIFGDGAGRWSDTTESTRIVISDIPSDWSDYMFLTFWAYSAETNDAGIEVVAYSESDTTSDDDYYKKEIIIDWTGWRLFEIPLHEFRVTREPVGWDKIDYIKIASSGWSHTPIESTDLIFDEMKLSSVRIGPKLAVDLPTNLVHPYLLLNQAEIDQIRVKIEQYPWAKTAYGFLKARADNWLDQTITVPDTGGGFYHAEDATEYAITERHYELADGARDLALMYQFTGNQAYMEKAKEILLAYAESYLTYELHDKNGRTGEQVDAGGRATSQGINEARWVIPLAWTYDLIYHDLSETERNAVADQMLRPVADLLVLNNEGLHNHQTWYNAGVGVIGFALGDKGYVWHALLKDDSCLGYQLENSVTGDGMWYEGSMHYQFYVLRALQPLVEATHHAGFDVYNIPQYKSMFDFMITYADPTMRLPTINDGRVVDLTDSDRVTYYELAYARWGDPRYVPILAESDRTGLNALLYGVAELGESERPVWQTQNYDQSGLAVLRSGTGADSIQGTFNYMGYQGGHSHADQLGIVLHGLGTPLAPDAGSIKYRLEEQEAWFKQALAHNTLVVDTQSQERIAAGTFKYVVASDSVQLASASSADLYPGVNLTRTLLLNDAYLIDIFNAESKQAHTYDWVYHSVGQFSTDDVNFQAAETAPGDANGYEYLSNLKTVDFDDDWQAAWQVASEQQVRIYVVGQDGTTYYTAQGPIAADVGDEIASEPLPVLISRRTVTSTQFVSIIQPAQTAAVIADITPVTLTDENGQQIPSDTLRALQIEGQSYTDYLILTDELAVRNIDHIQLNCTWAWLSQIDGNLHWLVIEGASISGEGWSVSQQDLGLDKAPPGMGMFLEVVAPVQLLIQNLHEYATYITLQGFMDTASEIIELDQDGTPRRTMPTKTNEDGTVKFLIQPGFLYEITGE